MLNIVASINASNFGDSSYLVLGIFGATITIVLLGLLAYRQISTDLGKGSEKKRAMLDITIAMLLGMFIIIMMLIFLP